MGIDDERKQRSEAREKSYAERSLTDMLIEAAGHVDCKCRYPDGNGPPCGREQLAAELRRRAGGAS